MKQVRTSLALTLTIGAIFMSTAAVSAEAAPRRLVAPVLVYHSLTEDVHRSQWAVNVVDFEAQLDHLSSAGYTVVSMDQLESALRGGAALPSRPVLITFDDGYKDTATEAMPRLIARGLPWTVFVATARLADGLKLTTDDVVAMSVSGATVAPHTSSHVSLTSIPRSKARQEILRSRDVLAGILGKPSKYFAYPYGDNDREVRRLVADAGFTLAFGMRRGSAHCSEGSLDMSRITVDGRWDLHRFKKELSDASAVNSDVTVTLDGYDRLISPGERLPFHGRLSGRGGMPLPCSTVSIQSRVSDKSAWSQAGGLAVTDATGGFYFTRRLLSPRGFRAVYAPPAFRFDGSGVASPPVKVRMTGSMWMRRTPAIDYGSRAKLRGRLRGVNGRSVSAVPVVLEYRPARGGTWRKLKTRWTDSAGRVGFTVAPSSNRRYRMSLEGDWLTSSVTVQKVRPKVSLTSSKRNARMGSVVRLGARVAPAHPRAKVKLEQLVRRASGGTQWAPVRYLMLDDRSRVTTRVPVTGALGRYRLVFPGDSDHARSSASVHVRVSAGTRR